MANNTDPAPEVPFDVQEAAVAAQAQLTPEEVAEFRQLRADRKAADEAAAKAAEEAAARLQPDTHHVHLGDGRVVTGSSIATHYDDGDGPVPVAGAYLRREFVSLP